MKKGTRSTLIVLGAIALVWLYYKPNFFPSELERCIEAREPEMIVSFNEEGIWNSLDLSDAFIKCVEDKKDIGLWSPRFSIPAKELDKIRSECLSEHEEDQRTMSSWLDNEVRTKATKVCNAQGIY